MKSNEAKIYVYGHVEMRIEQITTTEGKEEAQYLHHNQAGSTRMLSGSSGEVNGVYTYAPYGALQEHTGTATTQLGYDGQYTSPDTGLIYLRARIYDPDTAQFLTQDPLLALTGQPYTYANDNPLSYGDSTGLIFGIPGIPSWEEVGEGIVGWGDTITFGATRWVREELGINNVNTCSNAYQAGGYAGLATAALIPGEDDAEATELADAGASNLNEQLMLEEAANASGERIMEGKIGDANYPEDKFAKMEYVHESLGGERTAVHYWENLQTGERFGFKTK